MNTRAKVRSVVKIGEVSEVVKDDGDDRSGPKRYRRGRTAREGRPGVEITPLTETAARAMSRNKGRGKGDKTPRKEKE